MFIGLVLFFFPNYQKRISFFDGCILVALGWLLCAFFGSLPYFIALPVDFIDAFFESTSGFTTTGATIFKDIESLPPSILLWRSTTQWVGGMGIIVLVVAIIPYLNFTNTSLNIYQAESPGLSAQKLTPTIRQTSKFLWSFYLVLTILLFIALFFAGMDWFDSLNHAFTTISTAGFSTKNNSIAFFDSSLIEGIMIFFMLFSSINYTLHYNVLTRKSLKPYLDSELLFFFLIFIVFTLSIFLTFSQYGFTFRNTIFSIVSLITTSGFTVTDYGLWPLSPQLFLMFLMIMGGSSASTSGGVKAIRIYILVKYIYRELARLVHPRLVMNIKINKQHLDEEIISKVISFLFIHLLILTVSIFLVSLETEDFLTTITSVLSCISNVGPGFGEVGPSNTFADLSTFSKIVLSINMLMGRLELFTVIILFVPNFWRSYSKL